MDFPLFERTLKHVKDHGRLPDDMYSKEDQNELGECHVADEIIHHAQTETKSWFQALELSPENRHVELCVLDGFLLYSDPSKRSIPDSITELLDLKLFLHVTLAQTIERRGKRAGYVTLGDFWVDPPGYVEDVVWPNYAQEHAWMFDRGDVDGGELTSKVEDDGVVVAPGKGEQQMKELMLWGSERLKEKLESMTRA